MPKLDLDAFAPTNRTGYPGALADPVAGRWYRRLGPRAGIGDVGISHVTLQPGAWSSQRHWHEGEDEFVVILSGEAVLIDDGGRTPMRPGDCAAFPKGDANGHHLVNEGDAPCIFIAIGSKGSSDCHYPDADLHYDSRIDAYRHKDGKPY